MKRIETLRVELIVPITSSRAMIIRFRTLQAKAGTKNWVRGKLARAGSIVECAISESHQTGHRHTETLLSLVFIPPCAWDIMFLAFRSSLRSVSFLR